MASSKQSHLPLILIRMIFSFIFVTSSRDQFVCNVIPFFYDILRSHYFNLNSISVIGIYRARAIFSFSLFFLTNSFESKR